MLVSCFLESKEEFIIDLPSGIVLVSGDEIIYQEDKYKIDKISFNDNTGIMSYHVTLLPKKVLVGPDIYISTEDYYKIVELTKSHQKLMAVKTVKDLTGISLKEAKEFIDTIDENLD